MPRHAQAPGKALFQCVEPFAVFHGQVPEVYGNDRLVLEDDPILRTHRNHFVPAADRVEQATARPGERRHVDMPAETQPAVRSTPQFPVTEDTEEEISDAEQA